MSVKVPLTRGLYAVIDDDDADRVSQHRWHAEKVKQASDKFYARCSFWENGKCAPVRLHRFIARADRGMVVDHINGDGLDNRKGNLRVCTQSKNLMNRNVKQRQNTSGHPGVSWHKSTGKWRADIMVDGSPIWLGTFKEKQLAIEARKTAEHKYFGEYAPGKDIVPDTPTRIIERPPILTKSGVVGVTWDDQCNKWRSRICVNKKSIDLGWFTDKVQAINARRAAEGLQGQ